MRILTSLLQIQYRYAKRYWAPVTIFLLISVTGISFYPPSEVSSLGNDKYNHILAYATISFPISLVRPQRWTFLLVLCILWSGVIEFIQPYIQRSGEWLDILANVIGIWCGFLASLPIRRSLRNELSKDRL
ncbi:MAG: VanZ family protein [Myxococcota bacterium]|nr:VanZ family protein [Myxococcota bacterium]